MSEKPLETRIISDVEGNSGIEGMEICVLGYCHEFRKKGLFFPQYRGVLNLEAGEEIDFEQRWFIWDKISEICQAQTNSLIMEGAEGKKSRVTLKGVMKRKGWLNKRKVLEVTGVSYEGNAHDLGDDILGQVRKWQEEKKYFEKYLPWK